MNSQPVLTPKQLKNEFARKGITFTKWAIEHGYKPNAVYRVVNGTDKAIYGRAHEIAVKLGLRELTSDNDHARPSTRYVADSDEPIELTHLLGRATRNLFLQGLQALRKERLLAWETLCMLSAKRSQKPVSEDAFRVGEVDTLIARIGADTTAKTPEQVKRDFIAKGITISQWAETNGYSRQAVYTVLNGIDKGVYGRANEIAVKLGIREPADNSKLDNETKPKSSALINKSDLVSLVEKANFNLLLNGLYALKRERTRAWTATCAIAEQIGGEKPSFDLFEINKIKSIIFRLTSNPN